MAEASGKNQCARDSVLAAVRVDGYALQYADREIVLAAVQQDWQALKFTAESCRGDREIVLAAVKQDWRAVEFAAESCRGDREIVLAAVKQNGVALRCAAESCTSDRDIVLAAIKGNASALRWASDELMTDGTFANDTKQRYNILRISMISGRQAIVPCEIILDLTTEEVLWECCKKLGVSSTGSMRLVRGDDVVPARTHVRDWPGTRAPGEISEYQLVVQQS
eukprot:2973168-Amphidinium_carterae.1